MATPRNLKSLTALFRKLNAPNPEVWATSQLKEGINQLHRYLFLQQAWSRIISEGDAKWINQALADAETDPEAPFSGIGLALKRTLSNGTSREDIVDIVRGMQAKLLFDLCYLLDDPSLIEPETRNVGWCLAETDENFNPTSNIIGGLHESVLTTDPTGREMRPRRNRRIKRKP